MPQPPGTRDPNNHAAHEPHRQPDADAALTQPAPAPSGATRGPGAWLHRARRVALRLLLAVILGIALGAAAFYGVPALYQDFIQPRQSNAQRLSDLEEAVRQEHELDRQERASLALRLSQLETRLAALQAQADAQARELDLLANMPGRAARLEQDIEQALADIAALQDALGAADAPSQRLARQLQLVRAMELITRARLWLVQSNFGLAADEIDSARQALEALVATAPAEEAARLRPIADRLAMALTNVETAPVVAADDLEIAWKLLVAATAP